MPITIELSGIESFVEYVLLRDYKNQIVIAHASENEIFIVYGGGDEIVKAKLKKDVDEGIYQYSFENRELKKVKVEDTSAHERYVYIAKTKKVEGL